MYDVIIAGGGPAGLSAALVLGRCRRSVLLCDTGRPRNSDSHGLHNYLTRDGIKPGEFLRLAREELVEYRVEIRHEEVIDIAIVADGFETTLAEGTRLHSRKLLIATGVRDRVPRIDGIMDFYGRSVHHCPYCDGWEQRDKAIAIYGRGKAGLALALSLKTWSDDVMLFSDGSPRMSLLEQAELERFGIPLHIDRLARLEGTRGRLERIVMRDGSIVKREALFFTTGQDQHCSLPSRLGCRINSKGTIWADGSQCTSIPGVYVAGDASRDVQLVIVAAAEGTKAGIAINTELQIEDRR